jgi:hypothetical protein
MENKSSTPNNLFLSKWMAIAALWLSLCNIPGTNHLTINDSIKTELIETPYSLDIHKKLDWSFLNFDFLLTPNLTASHTTPYLFLQSETHTHIKFIQSLKKFVVFKSNFLFIQILPKIQNTEAQAI